MSSSSLSLAEIYWHHPSLLFMSLRKHLQSLLYLSLDSLRCILYYTATTIVGLILVILIAAPIAIVKFVVWLIAFLIVVYRRRCLCNCNYLLLNSSRLVFAPRSDNAAQAVAGVVLEIHKSEPLRPSPPDPNSVDHRGRDTPTLAPFSVQEVTEWLLSQIDNKVSHQHFNFNLIRLFGCYFWGYNGRISRWEPSSENVTGTTESNESLNKVAQPLCSNAAVESANQVFRLKPNTTVLRNSEDTTSENGTVGCSSEWGVICKVIERFFLNSGHHNHGAFFDDLTPLRQYSASSSRILFLYQQPCYLGDGYSLLRMLHLLCDDVLLVKGNCFKKASFRFKHRYSYHERSKYQIFSRIFSLPTVFGVLFPRLVKRADKNMLKDYFNCSSSSESQAYKIYVSRSIPWLKINGLKCLCRSSFNEVFLALLAETIRRYLINLNADPDTLNLSACLPVTTDTISRSSDVLMDHKLALVNVSLPVKSEGLLPRVFDTKRIVSKLRRSTEFSALNNAIALTGLLFPSNLHSWIWSEFIPSKTTFMYSSLYSPQFANTQTPPYLSKFSSRFPGYSATLNSLAYFQPPISKKIPLSFTVHTSADHVVVTNVVQDYVPNGQFFIAELEYQIDALLSFLVPRITTTSRYGLEGKVLNPKEEKRMQQIIEAYMEYSRRALAASQPLNCTEQPQLKIDRTFMRNYQKYLWHFRDEICKMGIPTSANVLPNMYEENLGKEYVDELKLKLMIGQVFDTESQKAIDDLKQEWLLEDSFASEGADAV